MDMTLILVSQTTPACMKESKMRLFGNTITRGSRIYDPGFKCSEGPADSFFVHPKPSNYTILTRSKSAKLSLEPPTYKIILWRLRRARINQRCNLSPSGFQDLPPEFRIKFFWTPGHKSIDLNEQADKAAREAAEEQDDPLILNSSLGSLLQRIRAHFHIRHFRFDTGRPQFKTSLKKIADTLAFLEKGNATVIFQLRSNHNALNANLHRLNLSDTDLCPTCKVPETTTHFLLYCKRYNVQRRDVQKQAKKAEIKTNLYSVNILSDSPIILPLLSNYVLHAKRFAFFVSYRSTKE
ncbi:hypothetical protein CROQUDRAFT_101707 [Cronartium quercuum f. sp. fusiforme G11]|uniref:RNase H type-1 domain-containing protein n=1 Tax=Cronartium quercuum f. sp. fusiforme G11 TaxID=708437 RepID=A0A9P6N7Y3_9BASI|nr:hypothetical protein CROQUDRAFT_101707 [Cronartium quercuum f. sp. fusiforme G11]